LNRRNALQRVAYMMGVAVSAPTMVAILEGCKSTTSTTGSVFSLTKDYQSLLAEIAEVIIPKTTTAGAKEAGVGPFIELLLKDCYTELQQNSFKAGLDTVEEESKKLGSGFVALPNEKKIEVIKIMQAKAKEESSAIEKAKEKDIESGLTKEDQKKKGDVEVAVPFFKIMKELTLFGYFTSEKGAKESLNYVPIPTRYDGCIKITPGTKAYAI
jgi:Gluconate 2-dehydrogenase subunit 3